jgi:hypothetical protein
VEDQIPILHPRLAGLREHYYRVRWILDSAANPPNEETKFRILVLAVYPARAIAEIMLDAAEQQELSGFKDPDRKKSRREFEQRYLAGLPHYLLIEKIRIHDFHRHGCVPDTQAILLSGPIKLTACAGEAGISFPIHGAGTMQVMTTGRSKVQEQRPLLQYGFKFWDDVSNTCLALDEILVPYLNAIGPVINQFKSLTG